MAAIYLSVCENVWVTGVLYEPAYVEKPLDTERNMRNTKPQKNQSQTES